MSIQELRIKFKGMYTNPEILLAALIVVASLSSFALGRLSISEKALISGSEIDPITKSNVLEIQDKTPTVTPPQGANAASAMQESSGYVASKNGTKYHLPWCGSAKQIKEENKIWFATKEEAERAGYTPAASCKGI